MLIRKMLRDVWKNKVPFVAIFLMMFAGNFIFSGITSEYNGMNKSFHSFIEETNLADVWVTSNGFNSTDIQTLKDDKNISNVEQRLLLNATLSNNSEKSVDLYVLDNTNDISKMKVVAGKNYSADIDGLWLDYTFANENDYKLNDTLTVDVNGHEIKKVIVGFCYSPEYIYNTKNGEMLPNHKNNGFAFVNEQFVSDLLPLSYNQLLIKGKGDIEKSVKDILGSNNITIVEKNNHPSYSMISDEITQHKEIGLIFVAVFFFIAMLITITTVHRLLNSQRMQIGILKSLGFRKRKLYIHYISHSTFVCAVGSLIGWCIGYIILPKILYPVMEEIYTLPKLSPSMLSGSWLMAIICTLICLLISMLVCRKYLRGNASIILYSNSTGKNYKDLPLYSLRKHLSFYGQWNVRDIFRNKLRSFMTIFGVIGCVSLLFASLGLYTSMNNMSDWTFDKIQTYNTKVTGDFTDEEYKNQLIKDMFGEELMETSVEIEHEGQEQTVAFTGLESQDFIRLYDTDNHNVNLKSGIAVSKNTAKEMNIKVGDRIKWRFSGSSTWYLSVVKVIIRTPMTQGITMMKTEMEKENIPFITTSIIGEEIENAKINTDYISSIQNRADLEESLSTMLNASIMLSTLFLIMAVLLGSVILYNLGTLSYMERYRDMATLKVLGFNNKRIRKLMIQQNIWLTIVGIIIGLPIGYGLLGIMVSTVQTSIDMETYAPVYVYGVSILGTFILSWIINKVLSLKVKSIDMVSALKINE